MLDSFLLSSQKLQFNSNLESLRSLRDQIADSRKSISIQHRILSLERIKCGKLRRFAEESRRAVSLRTRVSPADLESFPSLLRRPLLRVLSIDLDDISSSPLPGSLFPLPKKITDSMWASPSELLFDRLQSYDPRCLFFLSTFPVGQKKFRSHLKTVLLTTFSSSSVSHIHPNPAVEWLRSIVRLASFRRLKKRKKETSPTPLPESAIAESATDDTSPTPPRGQAPPSSETAPPNESGPGGDNVPEEEEDEEEEEGEGEGTERMDQEASGESTVDVDDDVSKTEKKKKNRKKKKNAVGYVGIFG